MLTVWQPQLIQDAIATNKKFEWPTDPSRMKMKKQTFSTDLF